MSDEFPAVAKVALSVVGFPARRAFAVGQALPLAPARARSLCRLSGAMGHAGGFLSLLVTTTVVFEVVDPITARTALSRPGELPPTGGAGDEPLARISRGTRR